MAKQKRFMSPGDKATRRPGNVARTEARREARVASQELRRQANVVRRHMKVLTPWEEACARRRARRQQGYWVPAA